MPIRLIKAKKLIEEGVFELEEFWDETVLQAKGIDYAILSHRWLSNEKDEVTYKDIKNPHEKPGFSKIQNVCRFALQKHLEHAWVDTCCINKDSDMEVSEAINSMFRWYKASKVCLVFLADVSDPTLIISEGERKGEMSDWFRRGWTLQELIAPADVDFYDQNWHFLGTKHDLSEIIVNETRIDEAVLLGRKALSSQSIAQRMCWASTRQTTRVEDTAYCLLGIFNVNMPLLYGEREKAFLRLQAEIIKQTDDHTIFAWFMNSPEPCGMLATSPCAFENCSKVKIMAGAKFRSAFSLTNRGLNITLKASHITTDTYFVRLECTSSPPISLLNHSIAIYLRRLGEDDQYARVMVGESSIIRVPFNDEDLADRGFHLDYYLSFVRAQLININVQQMICESKATWRKERINGFQLGEFVDSMQLNTSSPSPQWAEQSRVMSWQPACFQEMFKLDLHENYHPVKHLLLGFDFDYNPICICATSEGSLHNACNAGLDLRLPFRTKSWSEIRREESELAYFHFPQSIPLFSRSTNKLLRYVGYEAKKYPGVHILRGHRVRGLDVKLFHAVIPDRESMVRREQAASRDARNFRVILRKQEYGDKVVWAVDVNHLIDE